MPFGCLFRLMVLNFSCKSSLVSEGVCCFFHLLHIHFEPRHVKVYHILHGPFYSLFELSALIPYLISYWSLYGFFIILFMRDHVYILHRFSHYLTIFKFMPLFLLHAEWHLLKNQINSLKLYFPRLACPLKFSCHGFLCNLLVMLKKKDKYYT